MRANLIGMGTDERTRQPARFGLLLITLISTYLFSAFTSGRWIEAVQVVFFVVVALLALRTSPLRSGAVRVAAIAVAAGSVAAFPVALRSGDQAAVGAVNIWTSLLLLLAVAVIMHRVISLTSVTAQSIYGALSAYLLIGLMFAAFYAAIDHFGSDHFFVNNQPADAQTLQYFSFTTLTTLGYGDFTTADDGGRAVAVLEAMIGQVFLATLVARLVSAYGMPTRSNAHAPPTLPGTGDAREADDDEA